MNKVRVPTVYKGGIPLLSDISYPLRDAYLATTTLEGKQSQFSQHMLDIWNQESSETLSLRSLLAEGEQIAAQSLLRPSDDISSYFFTGDTFDGSSVIDPSTTAYLDKEAGFMVLPIESSEPLNGYINSINILEESIGRPGDLVNIRNLSYDSKNNPVVNISSDPHNRVEELIDNKSDTYFVWEYVVTPRVQSVRRSGDVNAIVSDPNGTKQDVKSLMGSNGLKWKGSIPGQGNVEKDIYTFTNGDKVVTNPSFSEIISLFKGNTSTVGDVLNLSRTVKLVTEFVFTDPVPLSSVRISPLVEDGLPEPKVIAINATMANGSTSKPPGLPRRISATSGREVSISRATKAGIGRADYNGSGVFFIRTNSKGVKSVRIELQADLAPTRFGVAHPFYIKNTETKEQTSIIGVRIRNKTSRGQERISNPNDSNYSVSSDTNYSLGGPLGNYLPLALSYSMDKATKKQSNLNFNSIKTKDWTVRTGEGNTLNNIANKVVGNIITNTGLSNILNKSNESKNVATIIGTSLGGKVGAALLGPYGILIGAALTGNLINSSKSTRVLSELGGSDIINAERAAIILKDISFDARVFSEDGEINSETLTFPGIARAASLYIKLDIPQDWPNGPWVTAQIKPIIEGIDSDWLDIKPNGSPWFNDPAKEVILFNSPTNKIKVRIKIKRPSGTAYQYETPIISSYTVKGLPK